MSLSFLVEQSLRNHQKIETFFAQILEQVGTEVAESIAHENLLDPKVLVAKHVRPIVDGYVDREFLGTKVYPTCKGAFKDGSPCTHRARGNGFCGMHAHQYQEYSARQRALRDFLRLRQNNPSHTHPPCEDLVEGCPMCAILRQKGNPFLLASKKPTAALLMHTK
jgi:hypothetical protein